MSIKTTKKITNFATITTATWTVDLDNAFGTSRILGRVLGIWPLDSLNFFSYFRVLFVIVTQLWMSINIIIILLVTINNCGALAIMEVLSVTICGFLSALKVSVVKFGHYEMLIIINNAVEDWNRFTDKKSRQIMLKYARTGKIMFITLMSVAFGGIIPLTVLRITPAMNLWSGRINANESFYSSPILPSCCISPDISVFSYIVSFTVETMHIIIICLADVGSDAFFFTIAMHVCGQFELLCSRFECLDKLNSDKEQELITIELIQRHQRLLLLAKNVESVYNLIILGQVLGDTILLCASTIALLVNLQLHDVSMVMQFIARILIISSQLFIFCYVGEVLSTQVEKLQLVIQNSNWYNMSHKLAKNIQFILMRMKHPLHLTASKMMDMNFESFKNIMKTMMSYFSILRIMILDKM